MKKRIDKKPWGKEEIFAINERVSVKIINVNPKKRLSLQKHKYRGEFWRILEGDVRVTKGNKKMIVKEGDELFVKKGVLHRIEALNKPIKVLEISFGKFDKNDITRVEDDYGRD